MDKHNNPFSILGAGGVSSPEETIAKAQIARRLGMGFVIIAVLLGILFLADSRFGEDDDGLPVGAKTEPPANLTIKTPENRDTAPVDAAALSTGQSVGGQITPAQPLQPEPIVPVIPADGSMPGAEALPAGAAKGTTSRPQITRNAKPAPGVVHTVPIKPAVPVVPATPSSVSPAAEPRKPVARLLSGGGHLLQAGVFNNYQKAEELHALLTLNGIPSTLETRVQVGPFGSKAEADAARAKLKSLGIESLMLPPRK